MTWMTMDVTYLTTPLSIIGTSGGMPSCISSVVVTFRNTPKLILTNPNRPQCYGTQPTSCPTPIKHRTHVGNPSSTSKSSCLSLRQPEQPDGPQTKHQLPAWELLPLRHLGLTIPAWHPGHLSPYPHLGSKPDLGPHRNPDSVLHIVIVPHCCSLPDPESVILVHTLDSFALTSPYPTMLYYDSSI